MTAQPPTQSHMHTPPSDGHKTPGADFISTWNNKILVLRTHVRKYLAFYVTCGAILIVVGFIALPVNYTAKVFVPFLTGIGTIGVVIIFWLQLLDQSNNTRKQMVAEQFKNAIEHLGNH